MRSRNDRRRSAAAILRFLACIYFVSVSAAYALPQGPAPGAPVTDISNIPKPLTDTFDQVR
ncbi:MAG: hypothetical protein ACRD3H_10815, partial [Terriglobales bacterium]